MGFWRCGYRGGVGALRYVIRSGGVVDTGDVRFVGVEGYTQTLTVDGPGSRLICRNGTVTVGSVRDSEAEH